MTLEKLAKTSWLYDLYRLGQAAGRQYDSTLVRKQILHHIVNGFEANSGSLALYNTADKSLTIVAGIDIPEKALGSRIEYGQGILGWVAKQGEPLLLNGDLTNDPRFQERRRQESKSPSSAMCWPLKIESRIIGALSLNRSEAREFYTEEDLQQGSVWVNLITAVIENSILHDEQNQRIAMLSKMNEGMQELNQKLEAAHNQLLQSEKLASIGQLAAGVAHEINNPVGYVYSNLNTLRKYVEDLFNVLHKYECLESAVPQNNELLESLRQLKKKVDLTFLKTDLSSLVDESREGLTRVTKIIQDLKDFSHVDQTDDWQLANLQNCIDSTLNIIKNEIKYKAKVVKQYSELPEVKCLPSQLNQVFMNLLVNAAQAIKQEGVITISTGAKEDKVWISVADNGEGIPPEHLNRIFDPFFTTKPVGKGTGLGLSVSYSIVQKHGGTIEVNSERGKGTTFTVTIPIEHIEGNAAAMLQTASA
jgi:signal transduction histidine kinase